MPLLYPRLSLHVDPANYSQRMLSYMTSTPITSPRTEDNSPVTMQSPCVDTGNVKEVESPVEAMDELFALVTSTMPTRPIILRCNLPTWHSEDSQDSLALRGVSGVDLHDFRALHEKSLLFVHGFMDRLKAAGFQVSYKLGVSTTTSCTLIRVTTGDPFTPCPASEFDEVCSELREKLSALVKRDRMYIARACSIPAIVIS
ncbi:hypothetical protein FRB94_011182 [Tulasnella sp. JGI-2019a]|nr:hypothetical protein FRB94_011182 [Tulasnella sp. JGI-2019a]